MPQFPAEAPISSPEKQPLPPLTHVMQNILEKNGSQNPLLASGARPLSMYCSASPQLILNVQQAAASSSSQTVV